MEKPCGGDGGCGENHGQLVNADPGIPSHGMEGKRWSGDQVDANTEVDRRPDANCAMCSGQRPCEVDATVPSGQLRGGHFAFAAIACFLMPLLFALGGALQFRSSETAQLCGALVGLSLGMLAWRAISSFLHDPERGK